MQSVCKTKWWKLLDENPNVLKTLKFVLNEEHSTLTFHFIIHHTIIISIRNMHFYVSISTFLLQAHYVFSGNEMGKNTVLFFHIFIFFNTRICFLAFSSEPENMFCVYIYLRATSSIWCICNMYEDRIDKNFSSNSNFLSSTA